MSKIKNFIKEHGLFILVFIISLFFMYIYCYNHNTYHVDESLSYSLSNYVSGWVQYPQNGILTRYTMDSYKVTSNAFQYDMVWHWQALDEHPPLYYALLHTICSFFPNSLSKWTGLGINIFFHMATIILIYVILNNLKDKKILNSIICLLYGLSPIVLEYSTMIRMYIMLTFTFTLFVYGALKIVLSGKKKYVWILMLSTIIGGLTNYFYYVFLAIFCLCILILFIIHKLDKKLLGICIGSIVVAVICNLLIFPWTLELFFQDNNSAIIAFDNVENSFISLSRVKRFLQLSPFGLYGTIGISLLLLISLIYLCWKEKDNISHGFILSCLVSFVCYFCFIATMAFDVHYRFTCASDILLFISLGYCLALLGEKINKKFIVEVIVLVVGIALLGIPNHSRYIYQPLQIAKKYQGDNLIVFSKENLHEYQKDTIFIERDYYGFVYNCTLNDESYSVSDDLYWLQQAVLYVDSSFSNQQVQDWLNVKTHLTTISDLGCTSNGYRLLLATQ